MRRPVIPLVTFTVVALGALFATLVAGYRPLYGLDLQGGLSVVLSPTEAVPNDVLDRSVDIIRQRVDGLGVAEPEIGRQGNNILVQLPGIKDRQRALDLIGTTAELRFRPVLKDGLPASDATLESLGITTTTGGSTTSTTTVSTAPGNTSASTTTAGSTTTAPTTTGSATTVPTTTVSTTTAAGGTSTAPTTTATDPANTTTTTTAPTTTLSPEQQRKQLEEQVGIGLPTTSRDDNKAESIVVLPEKDRKTGKEGTRYQLGPAALKGDAIEEARARAPQLQASGGWTIELTLKGGENGIDALNKTTTACFSRTPDCPTGRLGIELDGIVVFAGNVQSATFQRDQIQLSGNYTQKDAKDIALALRYGALPINLEPQSTQDVSATLGRDALHAGVIAGIIGLSIVSILVLLYYRWFGAVAVASLLLSAALLWAIIAWFGETQGLALTLAGVTGLIVSIGVSLDSNIVYIEHIKEDVWNGRTPRSAVDRAFKGAWSTIKKADSAALIGAGVLYFLTEGAVRGFAFYLGLATIIDLVATYMFAAPLCRLLARRKAFSDNPQRYGLPKPTPVGG